jgi:adenylate kinase family enzyme
MALIDKDYILNSNPTKKLRIAFENMKSNYTDTSAKAYMETYKDQPLAFIIENSRYIFSEPMYGLKFYMEAVLSNEYAFMFTEYENEKEKIESFVEEHGDKMSEAQKKMYDDLVSFVTEKYNDTIGTSTIISHACENESFKKEYDSFVESVYRLKDDNTKLEEINAFMESTKSPDLFYAVSPYLVKLNSSNFNYEVASNMNRFFKECTIENHSINEDEWKHYIESVIIVSKLYTDDIYREAVSTMRRQNSIIFDGLALESVKSQIDELFVEHITENAGLNKFNASTFDCFYSTPSNAVNRIFEDDDFYGIMKEDNDSFKMERTKLYETAMNILFEYVSHDYRTTDDTDSIIKGYNYFSETTSIEDAFIELSNSSFIVKESSDEDVNDEDIKNMDEEINHPKKAEAPTAKNLVNKVQIAAMDKESKFLKKKADSERKGLEAKNALKAVAAIPQNIVDSIKKALSEWDRLDDERREKYIKKPGFRKKYVRNLKLALLYGAGASINLALVPVVAMARSLSKQKDKRIRNAIIKDLETNIKLCDAKIEDAASEGNKDAKYQTMRIKGQLEQELLRVKTNSRYV